MISRHNGPMPNRDAPCFSPRIKMEKNRQVFLNLILLGLINTNANTRRILDLLLGQDRIDVNPHKLGSVYCGLAPWIRLLQAG